MLKNYNAKIGQEEIPQTIIVRYSKHNSGKRVIHFPIENDMTAKSMQPV